MVTKRKKENSKLKKGERKRADGRFEFRYYDESGERKSVVRKNLRDLREVEKEIEEGGLQRRKEKKVVAEKINTLNELFDIWFPTKVNLRDHARQICKQYYRRYVKDTIGEMKIQSVKNSDLKMLYANMFTEKELSKSTIKKVHNTLQQMLDLAVGNDYIAKNPAIGAFKEISHTDAPSKSKRTKFLTREQQDELLRYMKGSSRFRFWYPLMATAVGTGMRLSEFAGLTWDDVDLENRTISVNHTLGYYFRDDVGKSEFVWGDVKSKSSKRIIPISENVFEALKMQRKMQEEIEMPMPSINGKTGFCFYSGSGKFISEQRINHIIEDVIKLHNAERPEIPLPRFSAHTLRHTFATRLCEANVSIKAAQSILGHSDFQTTYNIYVGADENFVKNEFGKIKDLI